ncbi:hypothetical protein L9F63_024638, partial [Diploptera punctata]
VGEDGEWNVKNGIQTQNNDTSYQVTGLLPFTVYSFRVVAVNAMGRSRPSKESYYMVTLREAPSEVQCTSITVSTGALLKNKTFEDWRSTNSTRHFLEKKLMYCVKHRRNEHSAKLITKICGHDTATSIV